MALLAGAAGSARAADTVEPWDAGAFDVDLYLAFDGLGPGAPDRTYSSDVMVGYGLLPKLSIYLGTQLEADRDLAGVPPAVYLGAFGSALQTNHVDLDLFLDLRATGLSVRDLRLGPSFEINLDAHPEMRSAGLYLRVALPLVRRRGTEDSAPEDETALALEATLGAYMHLAPGHQLLLQPDAIYRPAPLDGETRWELGGLALGYNVLLGERLELITQVFVDLPQRDEEHLVGMMSGLIVTLPGT